MGPPAILVAITTLIELHPDSQAGRSGLARKLTRAASLDARSVRERVAKHGESSAFSAEYQKCTGWRSSSDAGNAMVPVSDAQLKSNSAVTQN